MCLNLMMMMMMMMMMMISSFKCILYIPNCLDWIILHYYTTEAASSIFTLSFIDLVNSAGTLNRNHIIS